MNPTKKKKNYCNIFRFLAPFALPDNSQQPQPQTTLDFLTPGKYFTHEMFLGLSIQTTYLCVLLTTYLLYSTLKSYFALSLIICLYVVAPT